MERHAVSAARAIARAEAAGLRLWLDAGAVRMEAASPPPPDLLAELRTHREDVAHLLTLRAAVARGGNALPDAPTAPPAAPNDDGDDEGAVMAAHYGAPAGPDMPQPDPMLRGLLAAARKLPPAWADSAAIPGTSTFCGCCDGRRWWGDALGWRCWTCHPCAPGLTVTERRT
jgi:hypothetical protein